MDIQEIRKQYPMYSDLSDQELADGFHSKFYSDIPKEEFYSKLGIGKSVPKSEAMKGLEAIESSAPLEAEAKPRALDYLSAPVEAAGSIVIGSAMQGLANIPAAAMDVTGIGDPNALLRSVDKWIPKPTSELGRTVTEKVGKVIEPLNAVMPNLQMMHTISSVGPLPNPLRKSVDPKLDAAKAEYEAKQAEGNPVNSFAARKAGFTFNTQTRRLERGSEYIDPLTNQIVDQRAGTKGSTTPRIDERFREPEQIPEERRLSLQAGEPLVTFQDGTTMTRAEWERAGKPNSDGVIPDKKALTTEDEFYNLLKEEENKLQGQDVDTSGVRNPYLLGDTKVNVEVDSVSGRPIFPEETKVDNTLVREDGSRRYGLSREGEDFVTINPDSISRLWLELSPEKKAEMGLKSAEDLQNFIEFHERKHMRDREFLGNAAMRRLGRTEVEKRANREARDINTRLEGDGSVGAARLPDNFREPYDGAPKQIPAKLKTPAQLRAYKEKLEGLLEKVNKKIADLEIPGADHGTTDIAKLDAYRKGLEAQISKLQDTITAGRKMGFSFESKKPSKTSGKKNKVSTEEVPDRLDEVFKDEAEQIYQQARNAGKSDAQARQEVIDQLREIYGDGPVDMNMGIPFSKEHWDMIKGFFSKTPSLKEFAAHLGAAPNDQIVRDLYNKYYGKEVVDLTPEQTAITKIPGLKETTSPELQPLPDMIDRWKTETDISSTPTARALRENLSSGGRMTAMRTGNSFIDWNIENILGETRRAQVIIKTIQNEIKGEANKLTGTIFQQFRTKGESAKLFVEAIYSLLKSEGKLELPNIRPEAKKFADTLRKHLDELGLKIQAELRAQGVENFQWRPNYLAGVFFGPYRSLVKDSSGKVLGVVAGKTAKEAAHAIEYVKQNMPDVTFDMVEYNPKFDTGPGSLGARYGKASEVLELLRNDEPMARQFQETLGDYYAKVQENYMGYKQHFKNKSGVFGSEGSRPWADGLSNARDLLEAQLGIIDHGYHWLAEQKLARDINEIFTNPDIALPESKRYVAEYLDHAFGRTKDHLAMFDSAMDYSARMLGISPSAFKEMTAVARNVALTGVLGMSGGFALSQFVQVPQALAIAVSKAVGEGFHGSIAGSKLIGATDLVNGINGKFENMSAEGRYFFQYFTKNGVLDPHLVEHTIHRKIVSTTGMNPIQKALWETVNATFKTGELASDFIGKYSIEKPEAWTRGTFAMTMAHFYKSAGMSLKEAAIKADKDTSVLFVDYSSQERAMMFQRMGELGKLASTVSTFKLNNLNQWFTFPNKKMYGTLAALAVSTWLTTGLYGMPFGDEAEFGATFLKGKGLVDTTPREWLLSNAPKTVSFGPLSSALTPFGGPDVALHPKFSQNNVIPDDMVGFIYPLLSFYTNKIEKGTDWVKSGFAKQEGAVLARELVPGNFKYAVDYLGLTNEKGLTIDPNQIHDKNPAHYDRTKNEWKASVALGVPSQREWKAKQMSQLDKVSQKAWKDSTVRKVQSTMSAWVEKDEKEFKRLFNEAVKYNPDAAQQIVDRIKGNAVSSSVPFEKMLEMQFAKRATSQHGVKGLQQFKLMQENK